MKTGLILAACGGVTLVVIAGVISSHWERRQGPFVNAPKIVSALHQFSRDQLARGLPISAEISLRDLVRGGYLTTNDVRAFDGVDVVFTPRADDNNPELVIARARMRDGGITCLLSDGSVQQMSRKKFEQLSSPDGQPDAAANQGQPVASDTNLTPAAAGSGR